MRTFTNVRLVQIIPSKRFIPKTRPYQVIELDDVFKMTLKADVLKSANVHSQIACVNGNAYHALHCTSSFRLTELVPHNPLISSVSPRQLDDNLKQIIIHSDIRIPSNGTERMVIEIAGDDNSFRSDKSESSLEENKSSLVPDDNACGSTETVSLVSNMPIGKTYGLGQFSKPHFRMQKRLSIEEKVFEEFLITDQYAHILEDFNPDYFDATL